MRLCYRQLTLLLLLLLVLSGCYDAVHPPRGLELSLCMPAQEQAGRRRIPGDPGLTERFELPKYAYVFVMKESNGIWSVWRKEEVPLLAEHWVLTRYHGSNNTYGDSIYRYDAPIQYVMKGEKVKGRVYAICSNKRLTFATAMNNITTLSELTNWQFDTSPDSIQQNLQNIYSTPYNYEVNGTYYCSFDCTHDNSSAVDLILYHLAVKVDLTWNVAEDKRINEESPGSAVRLTYMEARNLFAEYAYCFRPMENRAGSPLVSGYTIADIVTSGDEGLWWEGRSYFYTIPYTTTGVAGYFPLQLRMETNSSGDYYRPTLYLQVDTESPFVPWLRATINISQPLENKTDSKLINS